MEKRNGLPEKCCQQTTRDLFPLTLRPSCQAIRSDAQYHARNMARRLRSPLGISSAPPSPCFAEPVMPGSRFARLVTNMAFALMLAAPAGAFAQDSEQPTATFKERFPNGQPSTQPSTRPAHETPEAAKEPKVATAIVAKAKRPRSRVVVVPRSFLDAGTEVMPGERKFLDYAFSPTHTTLDVVTNTGGRVGWHNSPLPGPFFPQSN